MRIRALDVAMSTRAWIAAHAMQRADRDRTPTHGRATNVTTCFQCGSDTTNKKDCPSCHEPVVWRPKPKRELEMPVKMRIHAALAKIGVMAKIHNVDNRLMHTGLGPGTSDIICVVPPFGRFLAIEVKRPGYTPSDVSADQRAFLCAVRQFGGVSGIASSVDQALALVAEARRESPLDVRAPQP